MKAFLWISLFTFLTLYFTGCSGFNADQLTPVGSAPTFEDPYLIVDRVQVDLEATASGVVARVKPNIMSLILPNAIAYSGSTPPSATLTGIAYNNPATLVGFSLDLSGLAAGSVTNDLLSYGNLAIAGLDDNNLKVCPSSGQANSGTQKCNKAKIRLYSTTGSADGVLRHTDGYDIPVLVAGLPVGVGVANAAYVQSYTIAANKNRLRASDLTGQTANFPVSIDLSNAGAGSYSATIIVEYVLIKE